MMDNFFAKKGLGFNRNHQPSPNTPSQPSFPLTDRYPTQQFNPSNIPRPSSEYISTSQNQSFTSSLYGNRLPDSSLSSSNATNNQTHLSKPPLPNYQQSQQYLQIPDRNQPINTHKRTLSQYSNSVSKTSSNEFKEIHAQFPSVSTQDKTPKNMSSIEDNKSLVHIPHDKVDTGFKPISMGNIEVSNNIGKNNRPTNIKQIKEELLNQGRKQKQFGLREDSSRRELSSSRKYLGVSNNETTGTTGINTTSSVSKPLASSSTTAPFSTTNITPSNTASSTVTVAASNITTTSYSPTKVASSSYTAQSSSSGSYWIDQKLKLLKQIEEKDNKIAELQKNLQMAEQQVRTKKVIYESDKRKAEGMKNRLEIELDNTRKLLQVQRSKSDEAQQKMDKLMFFEDDLIHARDYNRIKRQIEDVLRENAAMYQDHQKFILEVAQNRRQLTNRIEQLEVELNKHKMESARWRQKIQGLNQVGQDKVILVKLQHEINFLLKKSQQNMEILLKKQQSLEKAHIMIKQLTQKQNRRAQSEKNLLDGLSMQQLTQTIARYQSRLNDMNQMLEQKKFQIDRQKRTIDCLATELRKHREDKMINSLKERSNENHLKNELTAVQHQLHSEIQLQTKKIFNLEAKYERKAKEAVEKDKFIKDFMLKRVKDIETNSFEELIKIIRNYFHPEETLKESKDSKSTQKDSLESKEPVALNQNCPKTSQIVDNKPDLKEQPKVEESQKKKQVKDEKEQVVVKEEEKVEKNEEKEEEEGSSRLDNFEGLSEKESHQAPDEQLFESMEDPSEQKDYDVSANQKKEAQINKIVDLPLESPEDEEKKMGPNSQREFVGNREEGLPLLDESFGDDSDL